VTPLEQFFAEVDSRWPVPSSPPPRLPLRVIGCGALMLQVDYDRGTKDGDVLETECLHGQVRQQLIALAGAQSEVHRRRGFYLDVVPPALPFLPQAPLWRAMDDLNRGLRHFDIYALDVVDVVVSKLKRFHANDRSDISAMIDRGLVRHARLLERFRSAVDAYLMDARAAHLRSYLDHLHEVERDDFGADESEIDLPDWIDR
jgi:hypothetical protein